MERRFLLFRAGEEGFALALKEVAEVREYPPIYPLPLVPGYLLGLMNNHGSLTAVVDLARFMGEFGVGGDGKLLVLDAKLAALALWVDEVEAIVPEEAVEQVSEGELAWETAGLQTAFGPRKLLRVEGLVEAVEKQLTMDN